jgi:hypothetical protein
MPSEVPSLRLTWVSSNPPAHGRGVHRESVILGGDLDAPGGEILHGVIGPMVAELELVGAAAGGESQDLVAEADPEDGTLPMSSRTVLTSR